MSFQQHRATSLAICRHLCWFTTKPTWYSSRHARALNRATIAATNDAATFSEMRISHSHKTGRFSVCRELTISNMHFSTTFTYPQIIIETVNLHLQIIISTFRKHRTTKQISYEMQKEMHGRYLNTPYLRAAVGSSPVLTDNLSDRAFRSPRVIVHPFYLHSARVFL